MPLTLPDPHVFRRLGERSLTVAALKKWANLPQSRDRKGASLAPVMKSKRHWDAILPRILPSKGFAGCLRKLAALRTRPGADFLSE